MTPFPLTPRLFSYSTPHFISELFSSTPPHAQTELDLAIAMNWADKTVDEAKIRTFIRDHRLGSFLNSPLAGDSPGVWTAKEWRQAMYTIQHIAKEEGVLPLIHGLDSVHGANYVKDATIFPQQHGLGATFNPAHAREMGRVTAQDTMAGGVQWIYGPILDLGVNSRWYVRVCSMLKRGVFLFVPFLF
jgi:beta-glucosidase